MAKSYKDYCREAVLRDYKTYGKLFNSDGSRKPTPKLSCNLKEINKNTQREYLSKQKKDGWTDDSFTKKKPELEITGTEIKVKGRIVNVATLPVPKGCSKKEYNRIWMHNRRVNERIKKLKKEYGVTTIL